MNREREIKRIAGLIDDDISPELKADRLLDAGYGLVRQAVKEFAEKLKQVAVERADRGYLNGMTIVHYPPLLIYEDVDKLFNDIYGDNNAT